MGFIKEIFPQCDICNETFPDILKTSSQTILIGLMIKGGWKIVKHHRTKVDDAMLICPDCADKEEL